MLFIRDKVLPITTQTKTISPQCMVAVTFQFFTMGHIPHCKLAMLCYPKANKGTIIVGLTGPICYLGQVKSYPFALFNSEMLNLQVKKNIGFQLFAEMRSSELLHKMTEPTNNRGGGSQGRHHAILYQSKYSGLISDWEKG